MPVEGKERGLRSPYAAVAGVQFEHFTGLDSQRDYIAVLDSSFTVATNVRLSGARAISRGGQSKLHVSSLGTVVQGLFDASDVGA